MARVVKEQEYAARRNEILDVAARLVYTQGYEQMSIQDILDELQISKGALYHYFPSKQAMLEAIIERTHRDVIAILTPIVEDPNLPALEKFNSFLNTITNWKNARKAMLLSLMRVLYSDDNVIVREKQRTSGRQFLTPMLNQIIQQGIREGVLTISCPEPVGEVILSLLISLGDVLSELFLLESRDESVFEQIESTVTVYVFAIEQVLGVSHNVLQLVDPLSLREWFDIATSSPNLSKIDLEVA
jgi:AcrR family transcriptional regulator